jgi:hypothetical protein
MRVEVDDMSIVIKAHFDGKVIVPDEPVDLPVDTPVSATIRIVEARPGRSPEREAAWQRLKSLRIEGLSIPDKALERASIYEPPRGL